MPSAIEICVIFADPTFYLTEQVRALKNLSDPDFRVLYVPDQPFQPKDYQSLGLDSRFRVVPSGKASIPVKRNFSAKTALPDTDWIAFMDDDAYPPRDWMKNLKQRLMASQDLEILGGPSIAPPATPLRERAVGLARESYFGFGQRSRWSRPIAAAVQVPELPTSNIVIHRAAFDLPNSSFDETLPIGEDIEWCARMRTVHGKEVWMFPELYIYNHSRPLFYPVFFQFFRYGSHRMRIFLSRRLEGLSELLTVGLPMAFALLPAAFFFFPRAASVFTALYFAALAGEGLLWKKGPLEHVLRFLAIPFLHFAYGLGLLSRLAGFHRMETPTYVRPETVR